MWKSGADGIENAIHIRSHHFVPLFLGGCAKGTQCGNGSIINENVDSTESVNRSLYQFEDIVPLGDITTVNQNCVAGKATSRFFKLVPAPAIENDCRTFIKEPLGGRRANSGTCSCHDNDFSLKPFHRSYSCQYWRRVSVARNRAADFPYHKRQYPLSFVASINSSAIRQ
jgi:hypothetical protein